jgi:hypothetical protein
MRLQFIKKLPDELIGTHAPPRWQGRQLGENNLVCAEMVRLEWMRHAKANPMPPVQKSLAADSCKAANLFGLIDSNVVHPL